MVLGLDHVLSIMMHQTVYDYNKLYSVCTISRINTLREHAVETQNHKFMRIIVVTLLLCTSTWALWQEEKAGRKWGDDGRRFRHNAHVAVHSNNLTTIIHMNWWFGLISYRNRMWALCRHTTWSNKVYHVGKRWQKLCRLGRCWVHGTDMWWITANRGSTMPSPLVSFYHSLLP